MGNYIWCRQDEATHVIGESARPEHSPTIVALVADTGRASKTKGWDFDRPDYPLASSLDDANKEIGRRCRIFEGRLDFI
jgi:hypothetical protein